MLRFTEPAAVALVVLGVLLGTHVSTQRPAERSAAGRRPSLTAAGGCGHDSRQLLGAAARGEPHPHARPRAEGNRVHRRAPQLRPGGGEGDRQVRRPLLGRLRRLQVDRRRVVDAREAPGSGARRQARCADRPHRRRSAAGRLSAYLRPDQRARPEVQELRLLPRGLLVRASLRGRGGPPSGDGQEDAAHRRDAAGRSLRPAVRSRQAGLHPGPRGHRAGAGQAVACHRRAALPGSGEGHAGPPRPEALDLRAAVQAAGSPTAPSTSSASRCASASGTSAST